MTSINLKIFLCPHTYFIQMKTYYFNTFVAQLRLTLLTGKAISSFYYWEGLKKYVGTNIIVVLNT